MNFPRWSGDEDAFLPQQAKLVADPWLDGIFTMFSGRVIAWKAPQLPAERQLRTVVNWLRHFDISGCRASERKPVMTV